jgi:hypothetical protein
VLLAGFSSGFGRARPIRQRRFAFIYGKPVYMRPA